MLLCIHAPIANTILCKQALCICCTNTLLCKQALCVFAAQTRSFTNKPFVFAAVPTAKRAQTLVMPGTLPTHQTSEDMLASTSESLSASHPVGTHSSSSGGTSSGGTSSGGTSTGSSASSSTGSGIFSGSSGSASEQQHQLTAASFDNTVSGGSANQGNTVRMGKMLETQPRTRTAAHHHASNGR